jgi:hypothetical protein
VGWTTRYWGPTKFKIEAWDTHVGANVWRVVADYSTTAYAGGNQFQAQMPSGVFPKLRYTFYQASGSGGLIGVSELFFLHPEAARIYPGIIPGDMHESGNKLGLGTGAPAEKLHVEGDIWAREALHSQGGRVRRDFVTWNTTSGSNTPIHIKTNIKIKTYIMYRILVEGYNYGLARSINSDTVGYTYGGWACSGNVQNNNYANGVSISQYCSSDGYVVVRLDPNGSSYYLGFSASGWFTNPTGYGFDVTATVYQQTANL